MCTPSPPVARLIKHELHRLQLTPGQYAAAHLRALYGIVDRPKFQQRKWARNAMNCASGLRPGAPIFFTSDSPKATEYAELYAREKNAQIATRVANPSPPLHFDKATNWDSRPPSDYYGACLFRVV
jgi:hypothetical protein